MRFSSLSLGLALMAVAAPALAQSAATGPSGPTATTGLLHQPLAGTAAHPARTPAETERRMIEEQKRLERIMTICIGC